jgi:hypothetical protein
VAEKLHSIPGSLEAVWGRIKETLLGRDI